MMFKGTFLAAGTVAAISLGFSGLALAHGPGGSFGSPYFGWSYGCGLGPGNMGQGQIAHGLMGPGMMGQGLGQGQMGLGMMQPLRQDLSAGDVQHMMEHRLFWQGNPNVKIGKVEGEDGDTIVAEIVTMDGSLVQKLEVDRHTGWMRPAQ